MDWNKHLTYKKFYFLYTNSRNSTVRQNKKALVEAVGRTDSCVNRWLAGASSKPDHAMFKKDRRQTAVKLLRIFGIDNEDFHRITLAEEEFQKWYLCENALPCEVFIGFDNIINAMNEEMSAANSYIWLYRSHGTGFGSSKSIVDTLDQKLNNGENALLIIKRIVTLFKEESEDLKKICEHFIRMFYGHNNVHLRAIEKGYLGLNLLIVDNRVALICLPDYSGRSIGYAFKVQQRDLITCLQWLYKRVEAESTPIFTPHGSAQKREDVMTKVVQLSEKAMNEIPTISNMTSCEIINQPVPTPDQYVVNIEFLPDYCTYIGEMRRALKGVQTSCWLYRSHISDGKYDKPFIDAFIEKCNEIRAKDPKMQNCSFKRIVYFFDNDNLRTELDRCIQYMSTIENATLGIVRNQIDTLNMAIFDRSTAFLGFHDDEARAVLCGLKITDPRLVEGLINTYLRLESKVDKMLISDSDGDRQTQKHLALDYVSKGLMCVES